jgi:glucosamine--fructose-6-phosphate aminotransferase (isomerizing)
MCGIVGYIGDRDISSVLIAGLNRLSYRGYDSAGIAVISQGELSTWKRQGKLGELSSAISGLTILGHVGIGHTRWATHGVPNDINSHPHLSPNKKISVVHNGIIENYELLKSMLVEKEYIFRTQTDTEVVPHLIDYYYDGDLFKAINNCVKDLKGSYSLAIISEYEPDKIYVTKKGSPLILGKGNNENFLSSDINSLITHTKNIIYLEDDQVAIIEKHKITLFDKNLNEIEPKIHHINWDPTDSEKSGYDHFMLKEIFEQPTTLRQILSKYVDKDHTIHFKHLNKLDLKNASRFMIQACGTSWHSGLIGKYLIEQYSHTLTEVDISSEFRYRRMINQGNNIILAISQSGETADTLAGLREAKSHFFKVLSFVNVKNSSIDRESDAVIYSHSGQEIGVASTKNFLAQVSTLYLFAIYLSLIKKTISDEQAKDMVLELFKLPEYIEQILTQADKIEALANKYYLSDQFLFIGRGVNYPSALEGALKLKEISYIHATGYAAGELKHGPIALINPKLPVICICPKTSTYDKMLSNIQEVKSRKGKTIVIATEGDTEIAKHADDIIYIPKTSEDLTALLVCIPLQLFAYHVAVKLDCDVDQPRNLAKSVTVE